MASSRSTGVTRPKWSLNLEAILYPLNWFRFEPKVLFCNLEVILAINHILLSISIWPKLRIFKIATNGHTGLKSWQMVPIRVFYYRKNWQKSGGYQSTDCWPAADFLMLFQRKILMIFEKILTDGSEVWNLAQKCGLLMSTIYIFFIV